VLGFNVGGGGTSGRGETITAGIGVSSKGEKWGVRDGTARNSLKANKAMMAATNAHLIHFHLPRDTRASALSPVLALIVAMSCDGNIIASGRMIESPDDRASIGPMTSATRRNLSASTALNASQLNEKTSTMPSTEPCARMETARADRRPPRAIERSTRGSLSASSQSIVSPVSKHALVNPDLGSSREPTPGACPMLARQKTPSALRSATAAPSAAVATRACSTTILRARSSCWSSPLTTIILDGDTMSFRPPSLKPLLGKNQTLVQKGPDVN
jgi:hypothetical protein